MACTWTVRACGPDAPALPGHVAAALDEVDRVDRLMSHYRPESPLSRLNREAARGPVPVEAELFDFLVLCLRHGRESGGAFDVTVGPLMKAWGFFGGDGRLPGEDEREAALARVGYRHVVLDPRARTVRFDRPGLELDLGGIAKGYAVDRVVALLRSRGVPSALVNGGGSTLYGLGASPEGGPWTVEVRDPVDPRMAAFTVRLEDRALSVSGTSERSFEQGGAAYSHVMDPRTGRPVAGILGVAVLAATGTEGDALATAFLVEGVEAARRRLGRVSGAGAVFFLPEHGKGWRAVRLGSLGAGG